MPALPYLNQVHSTEPRKFAVTDEDGNTLRIEALGGRGYRVTVDPDIDYPAAFSMNFDTKAALIDWLTKA